MISLFLLYSLKRLPTWFCIILTFSQSVCVCVCCMFLCELCYADFVYLLRLSHMSKRRLTREGTNICETKGKNSVFFGMLVPTSVVVASLTNGDNAIGWLPISQRRTSPYLQIHSTVARVSVRLVYIRFRFLYIYDYRYIGSLCSIILVEIKSAFVLLKSHISANIITYIHIQ